MNEATAADPIALFRLWFKEAEESEPSEANAAALATADETGAPSVRMVLLKTADERGFVFYTNLESQKSREIEVNPRAALCFHWKSLHRQVRIEGTVTPVSDQEADEYFATRPRQSQIGAWASAQSRPLTGIFELERQIAQYAAKFGFGKVPRPPFWSGFRIMPVRIEFWREKPFRLHERLVYHRHENGWRTERLYP